jgi:hypothetical protein
MPHRLVRFLVFLSLGMTAAFLVTGRGEVDGGSGAACDSQSWARSLPETRAVVQRTGTVPAAAPVPAPPAPRTVFLVGELSEEGQIAFLANLAASGHPGVPLYDTAEFSRYLSALVESYEPDNVVPVGGFTGGIAGLQLRLGMGTEPPHECKHGMSGALWKMLFPKAARAVVCPAEPRRLLLQAACLAGVLRAPLLVTHSDKDESTQLRSRLKSWPLQEIYAVGTAVIPRLPSKARVVRLVDEEAVVAATVRHLGTHGAIQTLVIANPADSRKGLAPMSNLAPWLAITRRALLLLTNDDGDNAPALVNQALKRPRLHAADTLLLAADLRAIPVEHRANPLAGKDTQIEMEPLTPTGNEPFSFATGRLFHADPAVVTMMVARQKLLGERGAAAPRKAFVVSNPHGSLPLLEVFSRNTMRELANCGYEVTSRFGDQVTKKDVRGLLPQHDIWLWEGHHSTLIKDFEMPEWNEPLPGTLVFLQSCLALTEPKAQPLLQRGAVAVVGSSTRTYSASGGAFSLAFFDALLYDDRSLGASLRQAKNFLLAYSLLKEKRLGKDAKLGGANLRAAWAFTLWGDPTFHLPSASATGQPGVAHEVHGNSIVIKLPDTAYDKVVNGDFRAQMRPNARLAGLIRSDPDAGKHLVPFVFAEVHLPRASPQQTPRLRSRLPESHWVFCWDARRRCGYLLVTPRPRDERELRFHVDWSDEPIAVRAD